jgi:hypothetical protein
MTTAIIETITGASLTFGFTEVLENDVAIVSVSTSSSSEVTAPGWNGIYATGGGFATFWIELAAGQDRFTWTRTGFGAVQLVGVLLRSDSALYDPADLIAYTSSNPATLTDNEAILTFTGSGTGMGSFTGPGSWSLLASTTNVALWLRDPFQVPAGTTVLLTATGDTNAAVEIGTRVWGPGSIVVPPPGSGAGWSVWAVD